MRHPVYVALMLALCCACGCLALADGTSPAAVVRHLPQARHGDQDTYTVAAASGTDDWHPIRIHVHKDEVEKAFTECNKKVSASPRINNSNTHECGHNNRITAERKETLLNVQIPAAVKLHTDRLRVKPREGNLVIKKPDWFHSPRVCRLFKIPEEHFTQGVPNADLVLYIAIAMQAEHTKVCSEDDEKRPTSAVMTILPKEIGATRHLIRLVAHNMAHALGFNFDRMEALGMVHKVESGRWWYVYVVNSTNTLKAVREHYKCDTAIGMQIEKERTLEKASHWERRDAKDELMSVFIGDVSGMFYTTLTLSVFSDMGFYRANFDMAEPMSWGKNAGCSFLTDKCVKAGKTDYPDMFCTESKKPLVCTSDRFALGRCTVRSFSQRLPERYRFFVKPNVGAPSSEMMNHCPAIKPLASTACLDGDAAQMPGSRLGPQSRCLKGMALELKEASAQSTPVGDICANVKCGDNKVMVQYQGDDNWYDCPENESITPSATSPFRSGSIMCPKFHEVCTGLPEISPVDAVENKEGKSADNTASSGEDDEAASPASVVRELPTKEDKLEEKYTIVTKRGVDWKSIRIHASTEAVDAAVAKCKDWAAKATPKPVRGDTFQPDPDALDYPPPTENCSEETLITAKKRDILVNKLLPAAIKLHSDRLSVKPLQENLVLNKHLFGDGAPCSFIKPPEEHHTKGVPEADFVLYVTTNNVRNGSVKICAYGHGRRPISAVKNFLPSEIGETRRLVRMAAHDIAHALGFDTERMLRLNMIYSATVNWSPNKVIYFVNSSNTIDVVKKYYACDKAHNGMRLDMRSTEVPSSHWDRHVAKDELMSTYGDESSGMFYTALTLSTFHDMKFYRANFSMAEPMSWGRKGGCAVFRKEQKNIIKNQNSYADMLCKEESNVLQCTSDRFGLGTCAQTNFSLGVHGERNSIPDDYLNESQWHKPSWPVVQMSLTTACEGGDEYMMPGSLLGAESRCLTTESLQVKDGIHPYKSVHGICANVKCENDTVSVWYKGDENWHLCPEKGTIELSSNGTFVGGKIRCPKYSEVCSREPSSAGATVFKPVDNKPRAAPGHPTGKKDQNKSSNSDTAGKRSASSSSSSSGSSGSKKTVQSRKASNTPKDLDGYDVPPEMMNLTDEERALYHQHLLANGGLDSSTTTALMTSILALLCLATAILVSP